MRRIAAAVLAACVITAPACSRGGDASGGELPFVQIEPAPGSATDQAIVDAQKKLRADPEDSSAQLGLAQAFLQKAREVAEPAYYTRAGELLDRVDDQFPDDPRVLVAKGRLANAQHRFGESLDLGERAISVAPGSGQAYGVVVDAANELGRYPQALEATQQMVDLRPSLPSLSRVSYARELRGDLDGAVAAMTQAITAGTSVTGENLAYTQTLLGDLLVTQNNLDEAAEAYADAERSFADFPRAKVGRAKILVARERYGEAADILGEVVDEQPLDIYAIAYRDALAAAGRDEEAAEAADLVDAIAQLYEANGVNVDLELALFNAEEDPGEDAVEQARSALEERPSTKSHDALAWNLFRAGQLDEAREQIGEALQLNSRKPLIRYHAAEIAAASGDREAATEQLQIVLDTQPRFSARHVGDVKALADDLGLEVPPVDQA